MDVVVVGSCMTDLVSYCPRLPSPGETLIGHRFSVGFGGKGANQCVAACRLGARTAMVAKVGGDTFGQNYIKNFKDNNVNTDHVGVTEEAATGVAPIAVNDEGQNAIIIVPGANMKLSIGDVQSAECMIKTAKVLVCQLEINPDVTLAALKMAKKHGLRTVMNPAPAQSELHPEIYLNSDVFCPNESETELLTGLPIQTVEDAKKATEVFLQRGCQTVIITLGDNGTVLAQQSESPVHVPAKKVTAVDTTGAGDSFVGSLAYYLACLPCLPLEETVRRSGAIATMSVQKPGTQTSYPGREAVDPDLLSE